MNAIVAVDKNWGIGKDNQLLFHIPEDLRRFKEITIGGTVIMGRKTLDSLPGGKPLPDRRNIILSRRDNYYVEGAEVCREIGDLKSLLWRCSPLRTFVIGGDSVYRQLLSKCREVYVTRADASFPADAYFPNLDGAEAWEKIETGPLMEHKGLSFRYEVYARK